MTLYWLRADRRILLCLLIMAALAITALSPTPAKAHEVRPALLELTETAPEQFGVLWKQPVTDGKRLRLTPILPNTCIVSDERMNRFAGNTIIERWTITCPSSAMDRGQIAIEGLERSLTDVFVRIEKLDGTKRNQVLRPDARIWQLAEQSSGFESILQYLVIGAEHMLLGFDHLLFVLGLTLLVSRRQIIPVITSFTIAHSITLALTVFDIITLRTGPVELLIAASIVLLAIENIMKRRGLDTLASRRPWLIAFVIGLVHGLGFAGALNDIGLPRGEEAQALLLFNIGLEIGQITFVALILLLVALLAKLGEKVHEGAMILAIYGIGAIGCFWFFERLIV